MPKLTKDFDTRIAGIPCGIHVEFYSPELPMRITGSGFGDADPPEPEEFDFIVTDRRGYQADWLADKMDDDDEARILAEYKELECITRF